MKEYERRPGICCANCLRYDTCKRGNSLDDLCPSWTGSSSIFERKILEEKRRKPVREKIKKRAKKNAAMWAFGIFALALFAFFLCIAGTWDLKAELGIPDDVTLQEYLEEME